MINGIGEKSIESMKAQAEDLIESHKRNFQEVQMKSDDGDLDIGFKIMVRREGEGLFIETRITYIMSKVTDKRSAYVQENQMEIFPK
jgi:hypothetical protein